MIEIIDMSEYLSKMNDYISKKEGTIIVTNKETCVLIGDNDCNIEYCKSNNLPIYETHRGGTIVNFKGDICVGNYQTYFNNYSEIFLKKYTEWLVLKGINASFQGNDVLIDEKYKVGSYMSIYTEGCLYNALHLSFDMDKSLIENICMKEMEKIPDGISNYGIAYEELINFVKENC